jgi:hypothetical protein
MLRCVTISASPRPLVAESLAAAECEIDALWMLAMAA